MKRLTGSAAAGLGATAFLAAVLALGACGAESSPELAISVRTVRDPAGQQALVLSNATGNTWSDVRMVVEAVEADGSATPCGADRIATWAPGQEQRTKACGDKTRITLETGGASAQFVVADGRLFRKLGRKEIPVSN